MGKAVRIPNDACMALTSSSTFADVKAQYRDNCGYDVNGSAAQCKLFIEAVRHWLSYHLDEIRTGSEAFREDYRKLESELKEAKAWLTKNDTTYGGNQSVGRTVSTSCEYFRG